MREMIYRWELLMIVREATHNDVAAMAQVHVGVPGELLIEGSSPDELLANLSYEKRENGWHQILNNASKDGNFTYVAEDELGEILGFANGGVERAGRVQFVKATVKCDLYSQEPINEKESGGGA